MAPEQIKLRIKSRSHLDEMLYWYWTSINSVDGSDVDATYLLLRDHALEVYNHLLLISNKVGKESYSFKLNSPAARAFIIWWSIHEIAQGSLMQVLIGEFIAEIDQTSKSIINHNSINKF